MLRTPIALAHQSAAVRSGQVAPCGRRGAPAETTTPPLQDAPWYAVTNGTKLSLLILIGLALAPINGLAAQTTVDVWLWGEWQQRVVSERYLVVTPSASPTATLEAAGFFGFEFLGTIDCDYQVGLFERQLASGTPVPYSTADVIETLGVGLGQGYFWSPVFEDPAHPDYFGISPTPYTSLRFTPETTDAEARNIIHAAEIGTVVFNDAGSNRYIVISAVASGLVVNERMAPLVNHPQVAEVGLSWMPAGSCPSGGGGGSPWPPTGGTPAEIPTLSEVALGLLTVLLAAASLRRLRGHRGRQPPGSPTAGHQC